MYKATIELDDTDLLEILKAEDLIDKDRSSSVINKNKIIITAKDIVALKATINGIIKTIEAYERTSSSLK